MTVVSTANALEWVSSLLDGEKAQLGVIQQRLLENRWVKADDLRPTRPQLEEYFSWLYKGLVFAEQTLGKDCLPVFLGMCDEPEVIAKPIAHQVGITYNKAQDELIIPCYHVAFFATSKVGFTVRGTLLGLAAVRELDEVWKLEFSPPSFVALLIVKVCYRRLLTQAKPSPMLFFSEVFQKALTVFPPVASAP